MAEEEILNLKSLNRLQDRVVLGAKPGVRNSAKCGRIFVSTDSSSSSSPVKDYLLQGDTGVNILHGQAVFSTGSRNVVGSGFSRLASGEVIRRDGDPTFYVISAVVSDSVLLLSSPFTHASGIILGTYTAKKVLFGQAMVLGVENGVTGQHFSYDQGSSQWVVHSGATVTGPFGTGADATFVDGITTHYVSKSRPPSPDIQTEGTVYNKNLVVPHNNLPFLPFPVVPYPPDYSTLHVTRMVQGRDSSPVVQTHGVDFLLDYLQSPVYSPYQPPFSLRKSTSLFPITGFQAGFAVSDKYTGVWSVAVGTEKVTGIVEGSETLEMGGALEMEYITVTHQDMVNKYVTLSAIPTDGMVVNITEGTSQEPGRDYEIIGRRLSWNGFALDNDAMLPGVVIRIAYMPVPGSYRMIGGSNVVAGKRKLVPYQDYLLDYQQGLLTTVTIASSDFFVMEQVTLTQTDIDNKYILLPDVPQSDVALNGTNLTAQRPGHDFTVEGNKLRWDGMGLDQKAMKAGKTTLRLIYESFTGEAPVINVLYPQDYFDNGMNMYRGSGDFSQFEATDIRESGTKMVLDTDYNVNEKSGTFRVASELLDTECLGFFYYVQGTKVTEIKDSAPVLRVSQYPVQQGSLLVMSSGNSGDTLFLEEGTDFDFLYGTGALVFRPGVIPPGKISLEYNPVSALSCLIKKVSGTNGYSLRPLHEPALVASTTSIKMYNTALTGATLPTEFKVYSQDGKELALKNLKYLSGSKVLTFDPVSSLVKGSILRVSYTYQGKSIPYAPIMRVSHKLKKGDTWLYTDGSTLAAAEMTVGKVLMLSPHGESTRYYHQITEAREASYRNNEISFSGVLQADMLEPVVMITDTVVPFEVVQDTSVLPYRQGSPVITLRGNTTYSTQIGRMLRITCSGVDEIYRIKNATYKGDSTDIVIDPPALSTNLATASNLTALVSTTVVYTEGDNAIVTKYPILQQHPVNRISYLGDGYGEAKVTDEAILLNEFGPDGEVSYTIDRADVPTLIDLEIAVKALGGGGKFGVEWLFPKSMGMLTRYLVADNYLQRMPSKINATTQLARKRAGETAYQYLSEGQIPSQGDFYISSGIIVVRDTILRGDQYVAVYRGMDNMRGATGEPLYISASKVDPQKKGTVYNVTTDYLSQDQYYIQTKSEADFYNDNIIPYLDAVEGASEGASPMGSEGYGVPVTSVSDGGIVDNYYSLRLESDKYQFYRKVHGYYLGRMSSFANECEAITGPRLGNNDFTLQRGSRGYSGFKIAKDLDVDVTATFGVSDVFPVGYEGTSPEPDGRFSGIYRSFGRISMFNVQDESHALRGVVISDNGLYTARGFVPGDMVKADGTDRWYTVASVQSDNELWLTEPVDDEEDSGFKKSGDAYWQVVKAFFPWDDDKLKKVPANNLSYWVQVSSPSTYPLLDATGFPGAVAYGTKGDRFNLSSDPSWKNVLVSSYSLDGGGTWLEAEVNLSGMGGPFTADRVAEFLNNGATVRNPDPANTDTSKAGSVVKGFSELFTVTAETAYFDSSINVETALSIAWPLAMPAKRKGQTGTQDILVFRAVRPTMLFKFIEPGDSRVFSGVTYTTKKTGASTLGLPVDVVFAGNSNPMNAKSLATAEALYRQSTLSVLNSTMAEPNVLDRGNAYKHGIPLGAQLALMSPVTQALASKLLQAQGYAIQLTAETDATPEITDSFGKALSASLSYALQEQETLAASGRDSALLSHVQSDYPQYASGLTPVVVPLATVASSVASTISAGAPYITLSGSGANPHVVYGDKTKLGTVLGAPVYPQYDRSGATGDYEAFIPGNWDTEATTGPGVLSITCKKPYFTCTVSKGSMELYCQTGDVPGVLEKFEISFAGMDVLSQLSDKINRATKGFFKSVSLIPSAPLSSIPPATASATAAPLVISAKPYGYSLGAGCRYFIDSAMSLARLIPSPDMTVEVISTALVLRSSVLPGGQVIVPFTGNTTVAQMASAVTAATESTVQAVPNPLWLGYKFGVMAPATQVSMVDGHKVYFGMKTGVECYGVSDDNMLSAIAGTLFRKNQVSAYPAVYSARDTEIRSGFASEAIVENKEIWFGRMADREDGPCVRITSVKKQLLKKPRKRKHW